MQLTMNFKNMTSEATLKQTATISIPMINIFIHTII